MVSISVLMPVRNAVTSVPRAVASIRAQTCEDWEMLVVDDGSTDGTLECLREIARVDPRIRVLPCPPRGIAAALNTALAAAQGNFIARMDADDECRPERLAEQVAYLRSPAHRDIGLVSCLVEFGGDPVGGEGYARHVTWINSLVTPDAMALNRFVESPVAHPSVMFRREVAEKWGAYREGDFPEDYELWLRWMDAGVRFGKVSRVLLRWNDRPDRLSRSETRYDPEAFFRLKAKWIARWLAKQSACFRSHSVNAEATSRASVAKPLLVWGAGRPTRKRAAHLESNGVEIAGYVDVDAKKRTRALGGTGRPVFAPAELGSAGEQFVLGYVSTRGARELIRAELHARGHEEGRDFLMCA
jgi:glycosyltransferase involved in cell wall biosynthesis